MKGFILLALMGLVSAGDMPLASQDFCEVFGAIYVETDRRRASYLVYVEENEAFAGMLVYKEPSRLYADRRGIWYFTENRGMANYTIYYVKEKSQAHFTVAFTDTESFAGCN